MKKIIAILKKGDIAKVNGGVVCSCRGAGNVIYFSEVWYSDPIQAQTACLAIACELDQGNATSNFDYYVECTKDGALIFFMQGYCLKHFS